MNTQTMFLTKMVFLAKKAFPVFFNYFALLFWCLRFSHIENNNR